MIINDEDNKIFKVFLLVSLLKRVQLQATVYNMQRWTDKNEMKEWNSD